MSEVAHYEPPYQHLCCLQIQLFSSLALKVLTLKAPSQLQQTTFINIFSLFFRENKT